MLLSHARARRIGLDRLCSAKSRSSGTRSSFFCGPQPACAADNDGVGGRRGSTAHSQSDTGTPAQRQGPPPPFRQGRGDQTIRSRREHGRRQINVPEQIGRVRPMLVHGTGKSTADTGRKHRSDGRLDLIGLRCRESIANVVISVVRRNGPRYGLGLLNERRYYAAMNIGRPWAKVVEPPVRAGIRGPVVALCVRQVGQVGVLQKVKSALAPARGDHPHRQPAQGYCAYYLFTRAHRT